MTPHQPRQEASPKLSLLTTKRIARAAALSAGLIVGALLPAAASAAAAELSGKVTDASAKPLANIEVLVLEASGAGNVVAEAVTEEKGEYKLTTLAPGEYKVYFAPKTAPGATPENYVPQYYSGQSSRSMAEKVKIETSPVTGIDAKLQVGGQIKGKVTSPAAPAGLNGITVIAVETTPASPEPEYEEVLTNGQGEYELAGLPSGSYLVEFAPYSESNYFSQFYKAASTEPEAKPVEVKAGAEPVSLETAALSAESSISGNVSNAASRTSVSGATVTLYNAAGQALRTVKTGKAGNYAFLALHSGLYRVGFEDASLFQTQFYSGAGAFASAANVNVAEGAAVTGISAALAPDAPSDSAAPSISGATTVGAVLSCATGAWSAGPLAFSYSWSRNGVAIPGAVSATYAVAQADVGNRLGCTVTATNAQDGQASAASNTISVPAPRATVGTRSALVSRGAARVRIACEAQSCSGTIELIRRVTVRVRRGGLVRISHRTVVLARASYLLGAGQSGVLTLHLDAAGRRALQAARNRHLTVQLIASVSGGQTLRQSLVLSRRR